MTPLALALALAAPPLGATPTPTAADLAEQRRFVAGVADPKYTLDLIEGRPRLILLRRPPRLVQVADPAVMGHSFFTPTRLSVQGGWAGTTVMNLVFAGPPGGDDVVLSYLVRVLPDPEAKARRAAALQGLAADVNRAFPDTRVRLTPVGGAVRADGRSPDAAEAGRVLRAVR
jgi:pilus assembly protein CpaC